MNKLFINSVSCSLLQSAPFGSIVISFWFEYFFHFLFSCFRNDVCCHRTDAGMNLTRGARCSTVYGELWRMVFYDYYFQWTTQKTRKSASEERRYHRAATLPHKGYTLSLPVGFCSQQTTQCRGMKEKLVKFVFHTNDSEASVILWPNKHNCSIRSFSRIRRPNP